MNPIAYKIVEDIEQSLVGLQKQLRLARTLPEEVEITRVVQTDIGGHKFGYIEVGEQPIPWLFEQMPPTDLWAVHKNRPTDPVLGFVTLHMPWKGESNAAQLVAPFYVELYKSEGTRYMVLNWFTDIEDYTVHVARKAIKKTTFVDMPFRNFEEQNSEDGRRSILYWKDAYLKITDVFDVESED